MPVHGLTAVLQADPAQLEQLARIANAQVFMSVVAGFFAVLALGAGVLGYIVFRRVAHTLRHVERMIDQRAQPLIDGVNRVAADATAVANSVRRKVDDVLDTVDDVNLRLRHATDAAEQRVREFGAVLDVVQAEAQELLLDAASTAHGLHRAAKTLREPAVGRSGRLPRSMEESHDDG